MVCVLCFTNTQCDDDDNSTQPQTCEKTTIIDEAYYNDLGILNTPINSTQIIGDCLIIDFSGSGCDGESWEYDLIDSGAVAESSPEQRFLKFEFINNEACLAFINKTVSFDISMLRVNGSNSIMLNIEGYESSIQYNYN